MQKRYNNSVNGGKMTEQYNIYCDESCHLEHDRHPVMLLGAIWYPKDKIRAINKAIRQLKVQHNARGELKWSKVSQSRRTFYLELVDLFLTTPDLNFRGLVVDDKSKLNHNYFNQGDHDSFYYKMYFYLLRNLIKPYSLYEIYLDRKDTRSQTKVNTLHNILCRSIRDIEHECILKIQQVQSHEVELVQLTDFVIGAIGYRWHQKTENPVKAAVAETLSTKLRIDFLKSTPPWEEKFNLFVFSPKDASE